MKSAIIITGAVQLKLAQDEHQSNEQDLRKDKRSLKVQYITDLVKTIIIVFCTEKINIDVNLFLCQCLLL